VQRAIVLRRERPAISLRLGTGSLRVLLAASLATLVLLAIGAGSGSFPIAPADVVDALLGRGDPEAQYVLWNLRLPRLLTGALAGAALAMSGAILQALARNPLVAPDIIGINGGAALAAVAVIVLDAPSNLLVPAASAGALIAAAALYALSWRGGIGRYRLVLVGIGLAALAEAGIGYLLTRVPLLEAATAYTWMVGSLYAASWNDVQLLAVALAVLVPATLLLGHGLQALQLGDDAAAGLGVATERTRLALVVVAVGLAAVGVAVAGPVAFVAFIAPHLARRLARASGSGQLPASAAIGALLVVGADLIARRIVEPAELPVGIITVLLGAPFFLWLLVRADRVGAAA
jgi:iron complex transport system permease protein